MVIYEVDLGLNHVVRKFSFVLPKSAHKLITIPGESSADDEEEGGPGGVMVLCENFLIHYKDDKEQKKWA